MRVVLANGDQLGVMSSRDAYAKAQQLGLDLVEIAAQADPPVCKIIDYGKYKYEQAKLKKTKSKSSTRMKEIKFRIGTGQHDYNIKMNRAEGFLDTGHKVRFVVQFRGRENAHRELGFDVLKRIIDDFKQMGQVDQEPRLSGRIVGMTLSPLPSHLRKRKFQMFHGDLIEEDDHDEEEEADIAALDDVADSEESASSEATEEVES